MDKIYWGESPSIAKFDRDKFEEFLKQPPEEIKELCLDERRRLKHIIRAEHFDLPTLERICKTTKAARKVAKLQDRSMKAQLSDKAVLNYFAQPSTRTFLSFSTAEAHLGMRREEVRDKQTSSFAKGETEKDALRMFSSYFNAIVFRHPSDVYDLFALWIMKNSDREIPLISAGSGKTEHPTQALLDYYTMYESFGGDLDRKVILWVGDCLRGRTVHSGAKLMALHKNVTQYFVAPEKFQIDEETERYLRSKGTIIHKETHKLEDLVPVADVVYMTRIQDEHGGEGKYDPHFIFTEKMLDSMRDGAILMHPLPKREEIDPAIDYLKRDPRVMYWRQARNGMWTRVALLAYIFGKDKKIREKYNQILQAGRTHRNYNPSRKI